MSTKQFYQLSLSSLSSFLLLSLSLLINFLSFYVDMAQHGHSKPSSISNDKFLGERIWTDIVQFTLAWRRREWATQIGAFLQGWVTASKKREEKDVLYLLGDMGTGKMWSTNETAIISDVKGNMTMDVIGGLGGERRKRRVSGNAVVTSKLQSLKARGLCL